jgi:hypothetical protein
LEIVHGKRLSVRIRFPPPEFDTLGGMFFEDRHGYRLGTETSEAAAAYSDGLDRFLALTGDAEAPLTAAVTSDPGFAHGWSTLAALHHFNGDRDGTLAAIASARSRLSTATDRERGYLALLEAAVSARVADTLMLAAAHLERFPRDVLAIEQVMLSSHFGGGGAEDRARALSIFRHQAPNMGHDWAYQGVSAFVHQEAGLLEDAMRLAERSLQTHPANADAMHSIAHVHFERGAHTLGRDELAEWVSVHGIGGPFHVHFSWHLALHDVGLGEWAQALDRYRSIISPRVSGPGTIADAPTLLWRLALLGVDPAQLPWAELVEVAGPLAATPSFRYGDWHVAFALAGGGAESLLGELEAALIERSGGRPQAPAMIRVVRGLRAYVRRDLDAACRLLDMPHDSLPYLGGSRAQREVIEDTLIDALIRVDDLQRAGQILGDRLERRPSVRDEELLARCR